MGFVLYESGQMNVIDWLWRQLDVNKKTLIIQSIKLI